MAGELLFFRQLGDVGQIVQAGFAVAALIGSVGGQEQRQHTVVAGFFVGQHFGGLLFGLTVFAFKIRQTSGIKRLRGLAALAAGAETAQTAGGTEQRGEHAHQNIKQQHAQQQADDKQVEINPHQQGVHLNEYVAGINIGQQRQPDADGKQDDNPNQLFHACAPLVLASGLVSGLACGFSGCPPLLSSFAAGFDAAAGSEAFTAEAAGAAEAA